MATLHSADGESPALAQSASSSTSTTTTTIPVADASKKDKSTDKSAAATSNTLSTTTTTSKRTAQPTDGSAPIRPLDKKRARDRRAQQALRDRTRSTIHNLSEQVSTLTRVVERQTEELSMLRGQLEGVSAENVVLRKRVAAATAAAAAAAAAGGHGLATDTGGSPMDGSDTSAAGTSPHAMFSRPRPAPWQMTPLNGPATCIADTLFVGFVSAQRQVLSSQVPHSHTSPSVTSPTASTTSTHTSTSQPADMSTLLDRRRRGSDEVAKVASDIVRTYAEIETLPKQLAAHFLMTRLLKWLVLLDEPSWNEVPVWLRPTLAQLTIEHPSWIDRIPWPAARDYFIHHPEVSIDQFAAKYGTSLSIRWPYDPSMVVILPPGRTLDNTGSTNKNLNEFLVNPIYEHHIANLVNWEIGDVMRAAFPDMARLVDEAQAQSPQQSDYMRLGG
ncbi:hypothetical protein SBRCBS47491_006288 [Sporothrix bragantina]|uniref:BZIP transcription factor n=1 Tax=Sporothrix bragantina TaxID=671064 RepID=A0ABP0C4M2_9PEZI